MAYGLDDVIDTVTAHPWAAAAAVITGLFLLTRGGGSQAQGVDMSATLASMQIASDVNVALAGIQGQRDIAAIQAGRDIQLGAMEYAKLDRQAGLMGAIESMTNARMTSEVLSSQALQSFQSALGFTAARKDLENQRYQLDKMEALGFADINLNKELGFASIFSARDLGIAEISASENVAVSGMELEKFSLPFTERMHLQEQETVRNLAWRQKQIAKQAGKFDLFGGLIQGGFGLLSQGMSTFGGR